MLNRRAVGLGLMMAPSLLISGRSFGQTTEEEESFEQLTFPPISALDQPGLFGYKPATQAQIDKARLIVNNTPRGPAPIDIAKSFITRFSNTDAEAISQWPSPASWNPLVVEFFRSTNTKANNDMIAWCAAFANWCIERAGQAGSKSASSQSFLSRNFKKTDIPKRGDLAIFTCFDSQGRSLGLGHVTFFESRVDDRRISVVGGNQSVHGHSSIISASSFPSYDRPVRRTVGSRRVPCTMRLNTFVSLS